MPNTVRKLDPKEVKAMVTTQDEYLDNIDITINSCAGAEKVKLNEENSRAIKLLMVGYCDEQIDALYLAAIFDQGYTAKNLLDDAKKADGSDRNKFEDILENYMQASRHFSPYKVLAGMRAIVSNSSAKIN